MKPPRSHRSSPDRCSSGSHGSTKRSCGSDGFAFPNDITAAAATRRSRRHQAGSSSGSYNMPSSAKFYLKLYSVFLGMVAAFLSFCYVTLMLYVVSQTDPAAEDLLMARYLDISFGLLAFTSSLSLVYGAFVESKTWLTVWTVGSATVMVGNWCWLFYRKYGLSEPESLQRTQAWLAGLTVAYAALVLPVLKYYRLLESTIVRAAATTTVRKRCKFGSPGESEGWSTARKMKHWEAEGKLYETKEGYRVAIPIGESFNN